MVVFTSEGGILIGNGELFVIRELRHQGLSISAIARQAGLARKTAHLMHKAAVAPEAVRALAWAAQTRLCARYRHLLHAGKARNQVTTAVARELAGFIVPVGQEPAQQLCDHVVVRAAVCTRRRA